MKTVYFVRHGQSEGNISREFQAPTSPLTDTGKAQAKRIAERVAKLPFQTLIVSPLTRTKETADEIITATGKEPEYCELFKERVKPTAINGKSPDDPKALRLYNLWDKSLYTPSIRAEDGENFDDIIARADKALEFLKNRKESEILVVTHGYFLRTMIARVLFWKFLTPEAFRNFQARASMENSGLSALKYEKIRQQKFIAPLN